MNSIHHFNDVKVQKDIDEVWDMVCKACNKLIQDTKIFDFFEIGIIPNPNIHDMLRYLIVIDRLLDSILELVEHNELDNIDVRMIFNSKQQIFNMKQMANALLKEDRASYDEYLRKLKNQSPV
jgi:hypothetical protein